MRQEQDGSTRPVPPRGLRVTPQPVLLPGAPAPRHRRDACHGTRVTARVPPDGRARPAPGAAAARNPRSEPARAGGTGRPGPDTPPLTQGPLPSPRPWLPRRAPGPDGPAGPKECGPSEERGAVRCGCGAYGCCASSAAGAAGRRRACPARPPAPRAAPPPAPSRRRRTGAPRAPPHARARREKPRPPRAHPPTPRTCACGRATPTGKGPSRMLGVALRRPLPALARAAA